jgi:hypothetical protein
MRKFHLAGYCPGAQTGYCSQLAFQCTGRSVRRLIAISVRYVPLCYDDVSNRSIDQWIISLSSRTASKAAYSLISRVMSAKGEKKGDVIKAEEKERRWPGLAPRGVSVAASFVVWVMDGWMP